MAFVNLNDVYFPLDGGTVNGNVEIDGTLNVDDAVRIGNAKYISAKNTDGELRNMLGMNSNNNLLVGYGLYDNGEGATLIYGGDYINVRTRGGNAINTLTGGVSIPSGADLNDYDTVGNYSCASGTIAESLSNTPYTATGFTLKVHNLYNNNVAPETQYCQEIITAFGERYVRRRYGDTWYEWRKILSDNDVKDYIVKEGTSGMWTYRKWNSGIAECWCYTSESVWPQTQWGHAYYDSVKKGGHKYPFKFVDYPIFHITVTEKNGNIFPIIMSDDTKTSLPHFYGASFDWYTGLTMYENIYVVGKWK